MIELTYGNRTENLLGELGDDLSERAREAILLEPAVLITPNRNIEAWIRLRLADKLGLAANLRFRHLENFTADLLGQVCPERYSLLPLDTLEGAILAVLEDELLLAKEALKPVRHYLSKDDQATDMEQGAALKKVQLASRLAYLFQEYIYSRPEMTTSWRGDKRFGHSAQDFLRNIEKDPRARHTAAWQRALFEEVFKEGGILQSSPPPEGGRWATLDEILLDDDFFSCLKAYNLPPVYIFGVSYVARLFQLLFARLGKVATLKLYVLNPCAEFWEDMQTQHELFRRITQDKLPRQREKDTRHKGETEDPFGLLQDENPALCYWGRPGREHVRMMGELTECDFKSVFADPLSYGSNLLQLLQQDILMRAPERVLDVANKQGKTSEPLAPDQSLKFVYAPSLKRETQWVAEEIWRLMASQEKENPAERLRFSDIAVIVNSAEKEAYLPQIEASFSACHNLPCSISDLSGVGGFELIETFSLLLRLAFGRFSRAEVLAFLTRPAVTGKFSALSGEDLTNFADRLGIVFGADHSDHQGTYIDEDVYSWDQGVRRLALGAMMTGSENGEQQAFEAFDGRWLAEETAGSEKDKALLFNLLVRSLLDDCKYLAQAELTLKKWSDYFINLVEKYLSPHEGKTQDDRLLLISALAKLENMDFNRPVKGRVAVELALRLLEGLPGAKGQYLAEGVVVSSFLPMRAIPFKVIFLLGLGEGLFPAPGRRDALDLRALRRYAGDVDPAERDRYMFLETLICARQRLYLSFVSRNEQTGDALSPSAVVQELQHILKYGYLGEEGLKKITVRPPLRRHTEVLEGENIFSDQAREEARVKQVAESWQNGLKDKPSLDPKEEKDSGYTKFIKKLSSPAEREELKKMLKLSGTEDLQLPLGGWPAGHSFRPGKTEETYQLSLYQLRRFLECPMQGWASFMLGLTEQEEDRASVEEEDFYLKAGQETGLINHVYLKASSENLPFKDVYTKEALFRRLAGKLPLGVLGEMLEQKHLFILENLDLALKKALSEQQEGSTTDEENLLPLKKARFGPSPEVALNEIYIKPPEIELKPKETSNADKNIKVRLTGLSAPLTQDKKASVILLPRALDTGKTLAAEGTTFRYLLRGLTDQMVLAATTSEEASACRVIIVYASSSGKQGYRTLNFHRPGKKEALNWLTNLIGDLFLQSHAYLLPCEAVFYHYQKDEFETMDAAKIQNTIEALAQNNWSNFSCLWGPVPQPRLYNPLATDKIAAVIKRRFGLLFKQITHMEDFK